MSLKKKPGDWRMILEQLKACRTVFKISLLVSMLLACTCHALTLESMIESDTLASTLENKTVAYYFGSFDPIHNGHIGYIENVLQNQYADYILVAPAWGSDSFKTRTDTMHRINMLMRVFEKHPKVIVTTMSPLKMQQALTSTSLTQDDVSPKFNISWIGLLGSDTALMLENNKKALSLFMVGKKIHSDNAQTTRGGFMGIPVSAFILALRNQDSIVHLNQQLGTRPILHILNLPEGKENSSTKVRQLVKDGDCNIKEIPESVENYIKTYQLYL